MIPADCGFWRRNWILFWAFIKITSLVVGGGYAIIAAAQQEFVHRRKLLTEDDVLEMLTITQTVPGILACNSAVYIGWKLGGFSGAVSALLGSVVPSLVIITVIAAAISQVAHWIETPYVQGAFRGVIACIVGMVLVTAIRMRRKAVSGPLGWLIAAGCFAGLCIVNIGPAWLIAGAILLGIARVSCDFLRAKRSVASRE